MLPGFNHNIRYQDRVFHVQTEDVGLTHCKLVTQLFLDGHVLAVERSRYTELRALPDVERMSQVRERMQEQHKGVLRRLVEGGFDDTLSAFLTGSLTEDIPSVDDKLPDAVLAAAEVLTVASVDLGEPAPATGARTSVLGQPAPVDIEDIPFEDIVGSLEEWDPPTPEPPPQPQPSLRSRRIQPAQDTLVDVRLPAALRAAQERLRAQALSGSPPVTPDIRRVEVKGGQAVPPSSPTGRPGGPSPSSPTIPSGPPSALRRSRGSIPSNDQTMLEIDPVALKEAMARQRARLEAQRAGTPKTDDEESIVVSEPSLDDVIMSYLKDED
jgi:hypothetical protein